MTDDAARWYLIGLALGICIGTFVVAPALRNSKERNDYHVKALIRDAIQEHAAYQQRMAEWEASKKVVTDD